MPTLPLYNPTPATPAGWHQVTSPGGYEWWCFDGEDATGDVRFVATLFDGMPADAEYLRRYSRYRRWPTRFAPPLPGECPAVQFELYRGQEVVAQCAARHPPGSFRAEAESWIKIGQSSARVDGDLQLELSVESIRASLRFKPAWPHPSVERRLLPARTGDEHRWIVAAPMCEVDGEIRVANQQTITVRGRGYHDHRYGTAPPRLSLNRCLSGRVLLAGRAAVFHLAFAGDSTSIRDFHFLEADERGIRSHQERPPILQWPQRTEARIAVPTTVDFGAGLVLSSPKMLSATSFGMRLTYEASYAGESAGALCEMTTFGD